jgi:hypothetical protein
MVIIPNTSLFLHRFFYCLFSQNSENLLGEKHRLFSAKLILVYVCLSAMFVSVGHGREVYSV